MCSYFRIMKFSGADGKSMYRQLASSIAHFPYDLVHVINYPMTSVNLYVTRVDITFDNFRVSSSPITLELIRY